MTFDAQFSTKYSVYHGNLSRRLDKTIVNTCPLWSLKNFPFKTPTVWARRCVCWNSASTVGCILDRRKPQYKYTPTLSNYFELQFFYDRALPSLLTKHDLAWTFRKRFWNSSCRKFSKNLFLMWFVQLMLNQLSCKTTNYIWGNRNILQFYKRTKSEFKQSCTEVPSLTSVQQYSHYIFIDVTYQLVKAFWKV